MLKTIGLSFIDYRNRLQPSREECGIDDSARYNLIAVSSPHSELGLTVQCGHSGGKVSPVPESSEATAI